MKNFLKTIDKIKETQGAVFENKTFEELQKNETEEVQKLTPSERIGYLIEMYEKERIKLIDILKPYLQKQEYAQAKEHQDRLSHIGEFIAQLKLIK